MQAIRVLLPALLLLLAPSISEACARAVTGFEGPPERSDAVVLARLLADVDWTSRCCVVYETDARFAVRRSYSGERLRGEIPVHFFSPCGHAGPKLQRGADFVLYLRRTAVGWTSVTWATLGQAAGADPLVRKREPKVTPIPCSSRFCRPRRGDSDPFAEEKKQP